MSQRHCTKRAPTTEPRPSARAVPWTEGEGSYATWTDLDEHGGVLQIHERLANLMLSLYVLVPSAGMTTSSWWATADGSWLGAALVGLA